MSVATAPDRPEAGRPYRLEDSPGHLLRRAHQRHAALFQTHASATGLTPAQFAALLRLAEAGPIGQNALGRAAALDPATIQGVVQRLLARGLVATGRDPRDRRAVLLEATEAGRAALRPAMAAAAQANAALLAPLSEAERATLLALLRRLAATS